MTDYSKRIVDVTDLRDHSRPCRHGFYARCYQFVNEEGERADPRYDIVVMCPGGAPVDLTDLLQLLRDEGILEVSNE